MKFITRLFGKVKPIVSREIIIPDFSDIINTNQIEGIFEFIFHHDNAIARECATQIHSIISDRRNFRYKSSYNALNRIHLRKKDLKHFEKFDSSIRDSLLCIASMNNNGYVREEAIRLLSLAFSELTFPFMLNRTADWVEPIREFATQYIRNAISKLSPIYLVDQHKQLEWLLKVQRTDQSSLYSEILEHIFSTEHTQFLLESIDSYSDKNRFFIYKNILSGGDQPSQILEKVLHDKNSNIRLLGIRNLKTTLSSDLHAKLLTDRSVKIRLYMVNKVNEFNIDLFTNEIQTLIHDESAAIRSTSRKLLSEKGNSNHYNVYTKKLNHKPGPGTLIGLAEVGNKDDIESIMPFINSNVTKLRASALYALSLLDYSYSKVLAFNMLEDNENFVKRTSAKIIEREKSPSDLSILRDKYDSGTTDTKRLCLQLISKYGGWSIAGDFMKGLLEEDTKLKFMSSNLLGKWFSYSIRLAAKQSDFDKTYVLKIANNPELSEVNLSGNLRKILDEIPFIFS